MKVLKIKKETNCECEKNMKNAEEENKKEIGYARKHGKNFIWNERVL